jgi:phosphomannomutase/phosphoglucomutase
LRFTLSDGAWGLVRASSNTPNLVVVVESPNSAEDVKAVFQAIQNELARHDDVGEFDQTL